MKCIAVKEFFFKMIIEGKVLDSKNNDITNSIVKRANLLYQEDNNAVQKNIKKA